MKKETFLRQLCRRLNRLKREERVQVIESFREMISDRMEEGLSEEEAVACLGTPKEAAQEILNGMPEEKLLLEANKWELAHGGLSGRTAQQFIDYLLGQECRED